MKRIAIVGTQGVPAQYGGFETLVENLIGVNRSYNIKYTVFCSAKDYDDRRKTFKGAKLRYIPLFHANGAQSIFYDILSLMCCIIGFDTVLVLGVSGGVFLPFFRLLFHKKLIVNIDGLEHTRAKWGGFAKWYLRLSEKLAVRCADIVIADNKVIQQYVEEKYGKSSELIAYGGDHVLRNVSEEKQSSILNKYMLDKKGYALSICRIEPENKCDITLQAFAESGMPLVFIGNWNHSSYSKNLRFKYGMIHNIRILDSIYDLDVLYTLRKNCRLYVHGHSAGGTNPSLVEAMFFGCPILAYGVEYNRETTFNMAHYYLDAEQLKELSMNVKQDDGDLTDLTYHHYPWKNIIKQYEAIF